MVAFAEISAGKRRRHPKLEGPQDRVAVAGVHGEEDLESVQVPCLREPANTCCCWCQVIELPSSSHSQAVAHYMRSTIIPGTFPQVVVRVRPRWHEHVFDYTLGTRSIVVNAPEDSQS